MKTAGIEMMTLDHAAVIQRLASDAAVAATTRIPHPYPPESARAFIEGIMKERAEGSAYPFVIRDRGEVVGACGLHGVGNGQARELGYWVGRPFWGNGYATSAVKMVLQFAFKNLSLTRVGSTALETNAASRRVLEKNGFQLVRIEAHRDPLLKRPAEPLAIYELTAAAWHDFSNRPALAALHPLLGGILHAELAAGNEIAETGGGWPDPNSVFVRLQHVFRAPVVPLPAGITYTQHKSPNWWRADYSTQSPRHILAC